MPHRDNAANSDAVAAVAWWPCVVIMLETSNSLDIDSASVSLLFSIRKDRSGRSTSRTAPQVSKESDCQYHRLGRGLEKVYSHVPKPYIIVTS